MRLVTDFNVEAETVLRKAIRDVRSLVDCINDDLAGGVDMEELNLMVSTIRSTIEELDYHADDLRRLYNNWYRIHLDREAKLADREWRSQRGVR